jgi:hypothetical protein
LATRPHWPAQMSVRRRIMNSWHRGCVFTDQTSYVSKITINQARTETSMWLSFHAPAIRLCHTGPGLTRYRSIVFSECRIRFYCHVLLLSLRHCRLLRLTVRPFLPLPPSKVRLSPSMVPRQRPCHTPRVIMIQALQRTFPSCLGRCLGTGISESL